MENQFLAWLESADSRLLMAINYGHSPAQVSLMWWLSDKWIWLPLYLLLAVIAVRRFGPVRGMGGILAALLLVAVTDFACASLIRPAICRLRPSNPLNPLSGALHLVNDYRGGSYAFPSCHAANTAALAVFIWRWFSSHRIGIALLLWSSAVGYSRIYLGVHYPGDVLAGMAIGAVFAVVVVRWARRMRFVRRRASVLRRLLSAWFRTTA